MGQPGFPSTRPRKRICPNRARARGLRQWGVLVNAGYVFGTHHHCMHTPTKDTLPPTIRHLGLSRASISSLNSGVRLFEDARNGLSGSWRCPARKAMVSPCSPAVRRMVGTRIGARMVLDLYGKSKKNLISLSGANWQVMKVTEKARGICSPKYHRQRLKEKHGMRI